MNITGIKIYRKKTKFGGLVRILSSPSETRFCDGCVCCQCKTIRIFNDGTKHTVKNHRYVLHKNRYNALPELNMTDYTNLIKKMN